MYSLTAEGTCAYARAANFGESRTVTLVCEADGTLCGASEITIPAGETAGVSFDIPEETERVRVKIREKDALEADNMAEAAVKHDNGLRVAVTEDNVFLESALKVRPNLTVMRTEADALASTEADLYILGIDPLDGFLWMACATTKELICGRFVYMYPKYKGERDDERGKLVCEDQRCRFYGLVKGTGDRSADPDHAETGGRI